MNQKRDKFDPTRAELAMQEKNGKKLRAERTRTVYRPQEKKDEGRRKKDESTKAGETDSCPSSVWARTFAKLRFALPITPALTFREKKPGDIRE
jgi:hypothetical protein